MTREEAKQLLPIIQAFSEGKKIETKDINGDRWIELSDPKFLGNVESYRIKPEAKCIPFTYKDSHDFLGKCVKNSNFSFIVIASNMGGVFCSISNNFYTYLEAFNLITFLDGSKFGKLISE